MNDIATEAQRILAGACGKGGALQQSKLRLQVISDPDESGKVEVEMDCPKCGHRFRLYSRKMNCGHFHFLPACAACCAEYDARQERQKKTARRAADPLHDWQVICPPAFRDTSAAKIPPATLHAVLRWQYGKRGLLIHGDTDHFKTRSAIVLLARLHEEGKGIKACFAGDFALECQDAISRRSLREWFNLLMNADILFLDDFGHETITERIDEQLFNIVNRRELNESPMIITTNYNADLLSEKVESARIKPLFTRLSRCCECVSV